MAMLWGNSSLLNDGESTTTSVNVRRNEQREFKGRSRQIQEIRHEQVSDTTLDQDFVAPAPCYIPL